MEKSLAEELYPENFLPKVDIDITSTAYDKHCDSHDHDVDDLWCEDGSSWNGSVEELDATSDLNREWQRRRDHFHTIGYRDGLIAGKEASAQEGFNAGFTESVFVGFKWGLVRGVTSALACLPDDLRERMVESQEKRAKFDDLCQSVNGISTADALKSFHDQLSSKMVKESQNSESGPLSVDSDGQIYNASLLDKYHGELDSLVIDCPSIIVHRETEH